MDSQPGGGKLCHKSNVLYEWKCRDCENVYIGETSRSGFERIEEHWRYFENLSEKSHILKHYVNCHKDIPIKEMRMSVKILKGQPKKRISISIYLM